MILAKTINQTRKQVKKWKSEGKTVGFVPTMGYLHEGHASLIAKSVKENDKTVVSIFVNPIQFGPSEDLASYPRDLHRDCELCKALGCDLVFNPESEEMYGDNFCSYVDMSLLPDALCGLSRPTHFRGVQTVVTKLFNIVCPDRAYFGEKDAQQLAIIKKMVADLNMDIEIVPCPIIREADGLAKSSRNTYLSEQERKSALVLSRSLEIGKALIQNGEKDAKKVVLAIEQEIKKEPLAQIDYVNIVDCLTMQQIEIIDRPILCAIAVRIGSTRLIDNFSM